MTEERKTAVSPRLRFPEFRNSGDWHTERMANRYSFMPNNTLSRDKLNYEGGAAKNIHYGDIHTKFATRFDITRERVPYVNHGEVLPPAGSTAYCVEGDIVFADASEDTNDVGKSIEIVRLDGEQLLAGQHTILARRSDETLMVGFGGYLFRSERVRSQIRKVAQGTKVYGISPSRLANLELAYPRDAREQRKVAACLSSLDEVIAAQRQKMEALKAHKRGLMQQIFPREGETRPRHRFPEFRRCPDWVERKLSTSVRLVSGVHLSPDQYSTEGDIPYFSGPSDFTNNTERVSRWTEEVTARAKAHDTLITVKGSGVGEVWYLTLPSVALGRQLMAVRAVGSSRFMYYLLLRQRGRFQDLGSGNLIPGLSRDDILELSVPLPAIEEQQRIADCLGTLDAQIAAESDRLDALGRHKAALMQQLFPSPAGAG